ncbi:MAG TPA: LLM class flavin-dependent oxidoreductase [Caulobacterales bacterium]|nr:LLM class flavin-dependent oxidoreductase [Caulobacterales bacterium]
MKLGLLSLGDIIDDPVTGRKFSARERYAMTIEAAEVADRTGFYSINIGEHHGIDYTFSAPPVLLAAIAARTQRLKLTPAIALAANLDPLRVAEDYATVDVISNGRCEIATGRGTFFAKTYELMGQPIEESAERFAEAMELICKLWPGKPLEWQGRFRPAIRGEQLQPTPIQNQTLPIWIGGGASPETAILAGRLGLKLMLPSAFGKPANFVRVADTYREAFAKANHRHKPEVGACWHGWVARDTETAHKRFEPRYRAYHAFNQRVICRVNPDPPAFATVAFDYDWLTTEGPAIVGSPSDFVERLSKLHGVLDADVNIVKMDMGGVPREEYVDMVGLLGAEVVPELAKVR